MHIRTIILLVLFPTLANAQFGRPILDSLLNVLPTLKEDTNKVNVLAHISANYSRIDAGKGIVAGQQGAALARRLNWPPGIAFSMNSLGLCYIADAEYAKALACLDTASNVNEKIGNKAGLLLNYMNEAAVLDRQGYFSRATRTIRGDCRKWHKRIRPSPDPRLRRCHRRYDRCANPARGRNDLFT